MNPNQIIHLAASMGYQLSPDAVYLLTNTSYFESVGLLCEMGRMSPDALVFDVSDVDDVLGTLIIMDVQEVESMENRAHSMKRWGVIYRLRFLTVLLVTPKPYMRKIVLACRIHIRKVYW